MLRRGTAVIFSISEVDSLSSVLMRDCVIGWGVGDMDKERHIYHYPSEPRGYYSDARIVGYSTSRVMFRLYEALHG